MGNAAGTALGFPGPLRLEKYSEIPDDVEVTQTNRKDEDGGDAQKQSMQITTSSTNNSKKESDRLVLLPESLDPRKQESLWVLDMYSSANVGILVSYFSIGVISKLTQTPVQYYLISHLSASATQYSVYNTLHRLPWSLKFVFGMISDGIPVVGYRRKPWLIIGYSGFFLFNLYLYTLVTPSINQTILLVFSFTCFYVLADVCTDTMTVERSFYETDRKRGSIQSVGFIYRSFGKVLGSIMGTFLYDNGTQFSFDISQIFLVDALIPMICMGSVLWPLVELASLKEVPRPWEQLKEVWRVLQLRAVWRPMSFLYLFSVMQIPNSAWSNFLVWGLGFSDAQLGYLTITSSVVGCIGYISFKLFFFRTSWHRLYIGSSLVSFFFSILQVLLILRVNVALGIPDIVFAVGDDAIVALMESLHSMPSIIMFIMLCPEGAEGTTFALLTAAASLAGTVASDFGSALTDVWDVSNDTLAGGDFSGVLKLAILTSILQLSPLAFVWILPDTREEHAAAVAEGRTSFWGGLALTIVIFASLAFTVLLSVLMLYWNDISCYWNPNLSYCTESEV